METIETGILVIAIIGTVWQLITIRTQVLTGGIIVPSYVMVILCFSVCLLIVLVFGLSPFHLLWLGAISLLCGFLSLFFPPFLAIVMVFIALLTLTQRRDADNTMPRFQEHSTSKRRRKKRKKRGKS
jgi:hypothetical protein